MTADLQDVIKQSEKLDPVTRKVFAEYVQRLYNAAATLDTEQWQFLTAMISQLFDSAAMQPHWQQLASDPRQFDKFYQRAHKALEENKRTPGYTLGFLRGIGLDDELVNHVLAAPAKKQGRELRLALQAMVDEQAARGKPSPARYLTFEQFFHELGHTDKEIQAAAHADL